MSDLSTKRQPPLPPPSRSYIKNNQNNNINNNNPVNLNLNGNGRSSPRIKDNDLLQSVRETIQYVPISSSGGMSGQGQQQQIRSAGLPPTGGYGSSSNTSPGLAPPIASHERSQSSSLPATATLNEQNGMVGAGRQKFGRTMTAQPPSSPPKPPAKVRRSMSQNSMGSAGAGAAAGGGGVGGLQSGVAGIRLVPVKEKVGSRHSDVVDFWDGSGVGQSMWHHSGPYDAAAPSRNLHLPRTKAPMQAFHPPPPVPEKNGHSNPSDTTLTDHGISPAGPSSSQTTFAALPIVSPGLSGEQPSARPKPSHRLSQRAQAALRSNPPDSPGSKNGMATSPGMSGLSAQYSTSMPSSGGYFPESGHGGGDLEARDKEREREMKRRALKAAWGTDEPEPFEEFGFAQPTYEDNYDLTDEPTPLPTSKSAGGLSNYLSGRDKTKSPSALRTTNLPAVTPELGGEPSPTGQGGSDYFAGKQVAGGAGLKRTKSLMQKIKAMRENPNVPLEQGGVRSSSPSGSGGRQSPWQQEGITTTEDPARRNSFLSRRRPSKAGLMGPPPPLPNTNYHRNGSFSDSAGMASPEAREEVLNDDMDEYYTTPISPSAGVGGDSYVVVDSPKTKHIGGRERSKTHDSVSGMRSKSRTGAGAGGGEKGLPPPPPMPVMPDFSERGTAIRYDEGEKGDEFTSASNGVQRKTSLVKRMKDKMIR